MMETLPKAEQNQVVEAVRAYIANQQDDANWDNQFDSTQAKLTEAARKARKQIEEDGSQPFNLDCL